MERDQKQAYSRIKRISQKNDKTFTFRLFSKESATEKAIIKVQKRRLEVNDLSFAEAGDELDFGESQPQDYVAEVDWSKKAFKRKNAGKTAKYPYWDAKTRRNFRITTKLKTEWQEEELEYV